MIPAASSLTLIPSPIKQQKIVLHEHTNRNSTKHEPRSQYGVSLVKFDKTTLDQGLSTKNPTSGLSITDGERPSETSIKPPHPSHEAFYRAGRATAVVPSTHMDDGSGSLHKFVIQMGGSFEDSQVKVIPYFGGLFDE